MGFSSLQRSRARRSRFTQRFHPLAPCVFRVRALLTPCSPSSLPVVSDEAAPGIPTFRALFLPEIRRSFELTRALLSVALPTRDTLAVCPTGPGLLSKRIRLREGPGEPSSGLCSLRESGPLHLRFRVVQGADALLVFILPRAFSTVIRRVTVATRPLSRFTPIDSLASLDRRCAPASCQTRCRLVSLETAGPPEVPSLFRPVSSRVPAALGYWFPSRTSFRHRNAGSSLRAAWLPAGARRVRPSGLHQATRVAQRGGVVVAGRIAINELVCDPSHTNVQGRGAAEEGARTKCVGHSLSTFGACRCGDFSPR